MPYKLTFLILVRSRLEHILDVFPAGAEDLMLVSLKWQVNLHLAVRDNTRL